MTASAPPATHTPTLAAEAITGAHPVTVPDKERRLVTILFADLVESTALAEMLDPEEVHDLVTEAHAALSRTVEKYGGHVAKYLGDGLMALFGAPIAHEDDAERAVLAGLEMHEALTEVNEKRLAATPPLKMRIGITSGEVVAGAMAGTYDVIGNAANTAARLQGAADVGGVLVGLETMHLARRRIRFGERRELSLKGKAEAVQAFAALGLRERLAERWEVREQRAPLIGRREELALLFDLWARARRGEGQLAIVVGDAGLGKSRLVAEAVDLMQQEGEVQVLRGRSLSYSQQVSLWLITDLVRMLCDIKERDPPDRIRRQVTDTLGELLATQDEDTRTAAIDVLGEALGLPPGGSFVAGADAQIRRQVLVHSLRLLLEALAERAPTVVVLEDLHWMDAASTEVLDQVLTAVPGLRLVVIATHRPTWSSPWREWEWPQTVELEPLAHQDAAVLAGAVLGGLTLSPALERYVAEHAGGNPFFVEEMLRAMQDAGELLHQDGYVELSTGATERLPTTLTEILLARLDRLDRQVRSVAQVASVIGRTFAVRLLASISGREEVALEMPLAALQQAEIAFPQQLSYDGYVFKHALVRDVTYNTLLHKRRLALHLATARAIAQLYPAEEYVELIAYHYAKTEEHGEAAPWLERAGDRAATMYANEAAISSYEAARTRLELSGADRKELIRLDEKIGTIHLRMSRYDEALEHLNRAAQAHQAAGEVEAEASVVAKLGRLHADRGTPQEILVRAQQLLDHLTESSPSLTVARLYVALCYLFYAGGQYSECRRAAEQLTEVAGAAKDARVQAEGEVWRGAALLKLGHAEESLRAFQSAIPLAEVAGDPDIVRSALTQAALGHVFRGEYDRAKAYLERSLELAERIGDAARIAFTTGFLGYVAFNTGDWKEARELIERAMSINRALGFSWFFAYPLLWMGELNVAQGRWEEAAELLHQGITFSERGRDLQGLRFGGRAAATLDIVTGYPARAVARLEPLLDRPGLEEEDVTLFLPVLAWAHLELQEEARTEELVGTATERARRQSDLTILMDALVVQAMLDTRRRRWQEADSALEEAIELARRLPNAYRLARALRARGVLDLEQGEKQRSRPWLEEALSIFRRLGADKDAEQTEQIIAALAL